MVKQSKTKIQKLGSFTSKNFNKVKQLGKKYKKNKDISL